MENQFINTYPTGYSRRAQDPEFREEVRKEVKGMIMGSVKFDLIILGVCALLASIYPVLNFTSLDETMPVVFLILFFLWVLFVPAGLFFIVMVLFTVSLYFTDYKPLEKESIDCIVQKKKSWVSTTTDERGYTSKHNNYRITLKPESGMSIRVRDSKAKVYLPYVQEGDKVRYHPGFPYPIELFYKSAHNVNICVFCGAENDPLNGRCTKCSKPMLV